MTETALSITARFEDATTRTIAYSGFRPSSDSVGNFKAKVMQANDTGAKEDGQTNWGDYFIGSEGGRFVAFTSAVITTTEKSSVWAKTNDIKANSLKVGGVDNGDNRD